MATAQAGGRGGRTAQLVGGETLAPVGRTPHPPTHPPTHPTTHQLANPPPTGSKTKVKRHEPRTLAFELCYAENDPLKIMVYERWAFGGEGGSAG